MWICKLESHRSLLAQGRQRWHVAHISQRQSHWRRWWRSHRGHRQACGWASVRQAGCHAPDSRAPSRCCPSERPPGPHERRCTHAEETGHRHRHRGMRTPGASIHLASLKHCQTTGRYQVSHSMLIGLYCRWLLNPAVGYFSFILGNRLTSMKR